MHSHRINAAVFLLATGYWLLATSLPAQSFCPATLRSVTPAPRVCSPPPHLGPAPLLYVRFLGPEGLNVSLFTGQAGGRSYSVPVTVGLRPGYIYRLKVSRFPERPGALLFPTLEVRGTLFLPSRFKAADYPAPVEFTDLDFTGVLGGAVVTKVLVLERPDKATPAATSPDKPVVSEVLPNQDPLTEGRQRGRAVLLVNMGPRQFTPEEMERQAIPGTILLPGETSMSPAACRPYIPLEEAQPFDPILGPRCPEEECIHDGGDAGQPAGIDGDGRLQGLDPADTVAEYSDSAGRRRLAVSNRVCICVPRFLVVRGTAGLAGLSAEVGPGDTTGVEGQKFFQSRQGSENTRQFEHLAGLRGRQRASGAFNSESLGRVDRLEVLQGYHMDIGPVDLLGTKALVKLTGEQRTRFRKQVEFALKMSEPYSLSGVVQVEAGPQAVGRAAGIKVVSSLQEVRDITGICHEAPVPPPPAKPLVLLKWADRQSAKVGDVVTFFLRYSNQGGKPITDVALSDSLTPRLEYVPGSAKADRDAVFTLQENEAGSVILRWEISGTLLPGNRGVVSFQARVR